MADLEEINNLIYLNRTSISSDAWKSKKTGSCIILSPLVPLVSCRIAFQCVDVEAFALDLVRHRERSPLVAGLHSRTNKHLDQRWPRVRRLGRLAPPPPRAVPPSEILVGFVLYHRIHGLSVLCRSAKKSRPWTQAMDG